ncbi:hypothetical protein BKA63DRAFT_486759 [Paraphoma chrysanthemicola]|nr:hypothetical protein BKA63DRAFT_486759 [Paraphoma chrysanthemicola]
MAHVDLIDLTAASKHVVHTPPLPPCRPSLGLTQQVVAVGASKESKFGLGLSQSIVARAVGPQRLPRGLAHQRQWQDWPGSPHRLPSFCNTQRQAQSAVKVTLSMYDMPASAAREHPARNKLCRNSRQTPSLFRNLEAIHIRNYHDKGHTPTALSRSLSMALESVPRCSSATEMSKINLFMLSSRFGGDGCMDGPICFIK